MSPQTRVFVSVAGQNDNLGDSVLRRGLVRATGSDPSAQRHVHIGSNDESYLSAVGLDGTETLHASYDSYYRALDSSLAGARTIIGFNAGEVQVTSSRAHIGWKAAVRVRVARLRHGAAFHAGVGIRTPGQGSPRALRATLAACRLVSWRDEPSRASVGVGEVNADWAFGERGADAPPPTDGRNTLVVTMRGDRPAPSAEWLQAVRRFAEQQNLSITAFSQVVRDNERSVELARGLGAADTVLWNDGSTHAEWEAVARSLYRRSSAVVSDRLHALVIGLTENAMPLGLTVGSPEKLQRTLAVCGLDFATTGSADCSEDDLVAALAAIYGRLDELPSARSRAEASVDDLSRRIGALVSPEARLEKEVVR